MKTCWHDINVCNQYISLCKRTFRSLFLLEWIIQACEISWILNRYHPCCWHLRLHKFCKWKVTMDIIWFHENVLDESCSRICSDLNQQKMKCKNYVIGIETLLIILSLIWNYNRCLYLWFCNGSKSFPFHIQCMSDKRRKFLMIDKLA